jgi:peptidyl-prolyl cis-trans isomerase C
MTTYLNSRGVCVAAAALGLLVQAGAAGAASPIPLDGNPAATQPSPGERVVISIGDERITADEFAAMISDLPPAARAAMGGPHRRAIVEDLLRAKMLAHEARRRGIDNSASFRRQMAVVRDQVLADMLRNQIAADIREADLRQYFDAHREDFCRFRVRHIVIRTPDSPLEPRRGRPQLTDAQARDLAATICRRVTEKAEDFAAVAARESDDPRAETNGGELPVFAPGGAIDPAIDRAAHTLSVGQVSEPIRTVYGYHIVKLEQRPIPPFEEVRAEVANALIPERMRSLLQELRRTLNVTLDESVVGTLPHRTLPTTLPVSPAPQTSGNP